MAGSARAISPSQGVIIAGMQPLEREGVLVQLAGLLHGSQNGGAVVVLTGEAGIGKSTVIQALRDREVSASIVAGMCDPLVTPIPLGPAREIASACGELSHALSAASRHEFFELFHLALQEDGGPRAVVFEDLHWADEATLDLLRFLTRRIESIRALLVLTCRDDDAQQMEGLRRIVAGLPSQRLHRIRLRPLSRESVGIMAASASREHENLHEITGGNPFFVSEVLASDSSAVPPSIRDAVLARVADLSGTERSLLDAVAIVPGRAEWWMVDSLVPGGRDAADTLVVRGILLDDSGSLSFRHELARRTVEQEIPPGRKRELHTAALKVLEAQRIDESARLVHHAAAAARGEDVLRLAPLAAGRAAAVGAHREAVAHYRTALEFAGHLDPAARADLLEALGYECYLTDRIPEALNAREEALALREQLGDREGVGRNQRWKSRLLWFMGEGEEATRFADMAIRTLEDGAEGHELALAYSNRAQLHMLSEEVDAAVETGMRAITIAEQIGDDEVLAHALNNVGTSQMYAGIEGGRERLEQSLAIALTHDYEEHVARAYTNLAAKATRSFDYDYARSTLDAGIAYCEKRDLSAWSLHMLGWRARLRMELGDWDGATEDASAVIADEGASPVTRLTPMFVLGRIRARRGDPGSGPMIAEAMQIALRTGEPQRLGPVFVAAAEAAWLKHDSDRLREVAATIVATPHAQRDSFTMGELAFYLELGGIPLPLATGGPWTLSISGTWRDAAREWNEVRRPYERALALLSGDEPAQLQAIMILDGLGAAATATIARKIARDGGNRRLPQPQRTPRRRKHPSGLSMRQLEVLALLASGLRNSEIAERLFISSKTVEHHVSAILETIGARTRSEAAARAREIGVDPLTASTLEK